VCAAGLGGLYTTGRGCDYPGTVASEVIILSREVDRRILEVRSMLYELLTHCIPPSTIIKVRSHSVV
jgi:Replication factor C subunit 3, C-terminal domain